MCARGHDYAGEQDPIVQEAARDVTCPCTPQKIIEAVCEVEPLRQPDVAERETRITLSRVCDALYNRIVRPDKRQIASQYFRLQWMPRLGAARAWLVMVLRARCYWNEDELVVRDTCVIDGGYQTLAADLGVSVSTVKTCIGTPPGPTFLTKVATRRPGLGQVEMDFQVEMIDPVTPADQEHYGELATAHQKTDIAGSPTDQRLKFAGRNCDQKLESAGRPEQEVQFAGSSGNQEPESAAIWEPTKSQNLRNTKELVSTSFSKKDQQQQKEPEFAVVAADSSSEFTQTEVIDKLLQIGFQPLSVAQRYAATHAPDQVVGWCDYALAEGLGAGYVRTMLDAGEAAPITEEESAYFVHADYAEVTRPLSPRKQAMQQFGIAPETMDVWERALGELQLQMTKATFDTWLRGSLLLAVADGRATIGVRQAYSVDWLQNRLDKTVKRTLARHLGIEVDQVELAFEVL